MLGMCIATCIGTSRDNVMQSADSVSNHGNNKIIIMESIDVVVKELVQDSIRMKVTYLRHIVQLG